VWAGLELDPIQMLTAAIQRLPPGAAFSGFTAAWLHGLDPAPRDPIEATVPCASAVSGRSGIKLHRSALGTEVVIIRGVPATSIQRTLADLSPRLSLLEAVVIADAALHNSRLRLEELRAWVAAHGRLRGIRSLRRILEHVEPASESPMESRLRMVLVLGGLPRPRAQISVHDSSGRFVGRPDLYYEDHRLGIEYDGGTHRATLAADNRRQNALLRAGVRLLRFTAGDVLGSPGSVVSQVRQVLANPASAGNYGFEAPGKPAFAGSSGFETQA
jgi:very-short-patch-repair endonuclease